MTLRVFFDTCSSLTGLVKKGNKTFFAVRFRAVLLNPDMTPVNGDVEYTFMGPKGEAYKHQGDRLKYGVLEGHMPLHENCQEGQWTIRVQYEVNCSTH